MTPLIKVVHVVEDLRIGGLEKVVGSIVLNLDRKRFDPEVWCLVQGGKIAEEITAGGVPVQILAMGKRPSSAFLIGLAVKLRRASARIVHCHGYTACTVGRVAAVLARSSQIFAHIHTQGLWLRLRQRRIERVLAAFSTKIICVSESVRTFVVQDERIPRKKTEVIYDGVPDRSLPDKESARRHFGIQEDARVLGCVASLEPEKGHAILIDAVRRARTKLGNLTLLIVGDGSLRDELECQARRAGIAAVFAGRMVDVGLALPALDALALLSPEREGLSLALLEAMAASMPVMGSRVGGIPEVIEDGRNGLLCRAGDPADAARCILTLFQDPMLARSMGEAGRKTYLERFTLKEMVGRIEHLYECQR